MPRVVLKLLAGQFWTDGQNGDYMLPLLGITIKNTFIISIFW